jgi:hypothetical protein
MNRNHRSALDSIVETARDRGRPLIERAGRLGSALGDTLDDQLRTARRVAKRTQHAASDLADGVRLRTRREPLATLGIALGIGALVGMIVGWQAHRNRRSR